MEIYLIKHTIELVSGHELDNIITNLYGSYSDKNKAIKEAQEIINKLISRKYSVVADEDCIFDNYSIVVNKNNFNKWLEKNGIIVLYKGNNWSWYKKHFIEIVNMKVN